MLRSKRALAPVATTLLSALLVPISAGPADAATPVKWASPRSVETSPLRR